MSHFIFLFLFSNIFQQKLKATPSVSSQKSIGTCLRHLSHLQDQISIPYETIVSCLINQFRDHFPPATSIYDPWHADASVYGPVLVSHFPTATHAIVRGTAH